MQLFSGLLLQFHKEHTFNLSFFVYEILLTMEFCFKERKILSPTRATNGRFLQKKKNLESILWNLVLLESISYLCSHV